LYFFTPQQNKPAISSAFFLHTFFFPFFRSGYSTHGLSEERSYSLENVTKTISSLLEGYDIRLRPNFGGKSLIAFVEGATPAIDFMKHFRSKLSSKNFKYFSAKNFKNQCYGTDMVEVFGRYMIKLTPRANLTFVAIPAAATMVF
jgi:hypothetical protein